MWLVTSHYPQVAAARIKSDSGGMGSGVDGAQKPPIHGCKTEFTHPRIFPQNNSNIALL